MSTNPSDLFAQARCLTADVVQLVTSVASVDDATFNAAHRQDLRTYLDEANTLIEHLDRTLSE